MRILLTGVGGNIGRGLVDRLTDQGEHDLVLTDLIRPAWLRPERYGQVAFTAYLMFRWACAWMLSPGSAT